MIDILIPVLGRPDNAAKVVDSIREATENPYQILFICSPGDGEQWRACMESGGDSIIVLWNPGRADYSKKINKGFRITEGEWVFQGADDLHFHPGWDTEAIRVGTRQKRGVVGTNDLHNPSMRRKMHSTHSLFRRDYITKYGSGTLDGSGTVLSEAYDHQYVDNEFVETAMLRREWVFATNSKVEHLHPHWGLAERDATYEKAFRATKEDRALYVQRHQTLVRKRRR